MAKIKVACLLNTLNRDGMVQHTCEQNTACAGIPREQIEWMINDQGSKQKAVIKWGEEFAFHHIEQKENIGNSRGLNRLLHYAMKLDFDWFVIPGDDIDLPDNWMLDAIRAKERLGDECGIIGWSWRGHRGVDYDYSTGYFLPDRVFGAWALHKDVIEKCGYFAVFSKYGLWDSEYNERTKRAGLVNIYTGRASVHKGGDERNDDPYRMMKDAELAKAKVGYDVLMEKELTYLGYEETDYELG